MGSLEDAKNMLLEGLYEAQREYNISDDGQLVDRGGETSSACEPGFFTEIVEKLCGIHPDVEIQFISPRTAGLRLIKLVEKAAKRLLMEKISHINSASDYEDFMHWRKRFAEEGVSVLDSDFMHCQFDSSGSCLADIFYEEFQSLFKGRDDPNFLAM